MKKIIVVCLLLVPLLVFAEEDMGVLVPQWSDFAPKAFINISQPKGLSKLNPNNQYWYERKVEFEAAIDGCKALEANDERFNCYEVVKVKQYRLNNDYNARMEAKINESNPSIPGMHSPTDTMLPLGNYLNNMTRYMPNEFN